MCDNKANRLKDSCAMSCELKHPLEVGYQVFIVLLHNRGAVLSSLLQLLRATKVGRKDVR